MIASACLQPVVIVAHGADALCGGSVRVDAQRERAHRALARAAELVGAEHAALVRDADGVPVVHGGVHWSQSHTHDAAVAVVARGRVGVDIEPIATRRAADYAHVVSPHEHALFGDFDALAFTRLWTAKEALLKSAGVGLAELSLCRVASVTSSDRLVVRYRGRSLEVHQSIAHGFVVSLCSGIAVDTRIVWTWSV